MRRMTRLRRSVAGAAAVLLTSVVLAACGEVQEKNVSEQQAGADLRLVLGTKNFTESIIMGELYKRALEENGFQVVLRKNIGGTEVIDAQLEDGDIDAYPEYVDLTATILAGEDVLGKSREEVSELARDFYESRDQVMSDETPFGNPDAVAVTTPFAQNNRLRTIEDLRGLDEFTFGARPEFENREQGFAGMQSVYRLTNAEFVPVAIDARFVALFEGDVDAANIFSTDPQLKSGDYRVLEDTEGLFGYQHAALVIGEKKLNSLGSKKFMGVINTVNKQLTQSVMIDLNAAVDLDGRDPADVASEFIKQRNLFEN